MLPVVWECEQALCLRRQESDVCRCCQSQSNLHQPLQRTAFKTCSDARQASNATGGRRTTSLCLSGCDLSHHCQRQTAGNTVVSGISPTCKLHGDKTIFIVEPVASMLYNKHPNIMEMATYTTKEKYPALLTAYYQTLVRIILPAMLQHWILLFIFHGNRSHQAESRK